jgi:phasin
MAEKNKSPDPPPVNRNQKGIVQSDADARSAKKTTSQKSLSKVLAPSQKEAFSTSVELAVGEAPFSGPMEKTAVGAKMTMRVPDAVRDLAATTIDQAENAFGMWFDAAKKSMAAIPSPGGDISRQALSFTEQSMKAAFEHARKLIEAADLQQAMQIQSEFLKSQFTNAAQHMQEITGEITSSVKDASEGKSPALPSTAIQ